MAKVMGKLAARQVDTLKAGFHSDGGNLFLRVKDTGARSWVFRYKLAGKVTELGIGSKNALSLAQARELAGKMRNALASGQNPVCALKQRFELTEKTFAYSAKEMIEAKRSGWRNAKHIAQWSATLEQYAYSSIGNKLPADITLADVLAILTPIWSVKTETATRLRQRIEAVLDFAAVHEGAHGRYNPARWKGNLDQVLPKARKVVSRVHFPAAPYADVPRILSALRDKDLLSAHCLRFTILTAARSGEARGALWNEIDFAAKTWTIPAARMKANRLHRVPLCNEAIQILSAMREWRMVDSERVFNSDRGCGLLTDVAVNKTLHSIAPDVTVHGFRSSFRMWGAETTASPSAVLEAALAHVNPNEVEASYQRSDLFERRRELMQAWGSYCGSKGNVIQLLQSA
ncbi:MAG: integrase [Gallionellales bacterium RBG_16_56_9]|nr:MAG: integrase [Gallionellales bacterium RBG_16_56_9]